MCAPLLAGAAGAIGSMSASTMFAVSLGVSALQAGVGYIGEVQAANAQAEAQSANLQNMRDAAFSDMVNRAADTHAREDQERTATAIRVDNQVEAAARATATASATSESAGLSVDALFQDFDRQLSNYTDSQFQQLGFDMEQLERIREADQATAQGRVNSVPRQPIRTPNLLGAVAGVAGSAFDAFDRFSIRDPITGQRTFT